MRNVRSTRRFLTKEQFELLSFLNVTWTFKILDENEERAGTLPASYYFYVSNGNLYCFDALKVREFL